MAPPIPVQTSAGLEPAFDLSSYYPIFIYLVGVILFGVGAVTRFSGPVLKGGGNQNSNF